ncbi:hypothetical protein A3K93_09330 [Acinetobacter sp. NCu2D-2]|uniref:hypothetical protein n=1 Tax=Acinetobacter sp. NCu2D-2 TaxID=1608473 RepID=UPI0007CDC954|nr:hypothetical protein [Acinetobacter sp. NCu2D-2]ANF82374.1 hypothetical protein A3K93_09330 [Acinetobacter sp. NCu2D-2]
MTNNTLQQKLQEFPKAVWVQMYRDRIQLLNHQGQVEHTILPIQKYDHPRTIIANFEAAEMTLKQLIKMKKLPWYDPSYILFLQVKEEFEDGITFVENRALRELGYNAGARNVLIFDHQGQWLNTEKQPKRSAFINPVYSNVILIIVIGLILLAAIFLN